MALAAIIGVGMHPFGRHDDRTLVEMASEAVVQALKDAQVPPERVGAGFFASGLAARLFGDFTVGQNVLWEAGIHQVPVVNVENACTSGSTALYLAVLAVASGLAEVAVAAGGEKMCVPQFGLINSGESELDTRLGLVAPASFALRAVRHMADYGTTASQMAQVAVKNRRHASLNPLAMHRQPLSLEEVLASPMIVDPLTRLQCCPIADGAAAVVVCAPEMARRLGRGVWVEASVLVSGSYNSRPNLAVWETDFRACRQAYDQAGLGPEDLDLVECHDAFTISEILHYEALGLCPEGRGGELAQSGQTALGGRMPVNTGGGLLSRGHPVAATGLAQVYEVVTQLRGQAGPRQVEGARVGLAHCMGGDKEGDSKSCTVFVLGGSSRV